MGIELTPDEIYITEHIIASYWIDEAIKKETFEKQVECLRKRIVDASPLGYKEGFPFYYTGKGVITLSDDVSFVTNLRSYKILNMARLVIQQKSVTRNPKLTKPLFADKGKKSRELHVSQDVLEKFADMNSCQSLDMYDHNKSRAQVIDYLKRKWICGGSVSRGSKTLSVNLYECIPLEQYEGEFNDPHDEDADFYKGGRFRSRDGRWWVMTGYEIEVLPLKKGNSLFIKEKI